MHRCLVLFAVIGCRATSQPPATPDAVVAAIAAPDGWSVVRHGARATFEDAEHALRVVIEASDRDDAKVAITDAWFATSRAMILAPSSVDEPPPTGGWDAVANVAYTVPDGRSASAQWMQLGAKGYVVLVEGDAKAAAKREAQVAGLVAAIKPPGLVAEKLAAPVRAIDRANIDPFAERALAELDVPGAAIAVSVDGKVVYERVLGVKERGKPEPVTFDTRFLVASITKPMTTMMEAALVDRKVIRWDQPVTDILPTFALGDPDITAQLQMWHMSCACTGMPRQDMEGLFEWKNVTADDRLAVMKTMKPTTKIGETFQYSNPIIAAGGFIAAHAFAPAMTLDHAFAHTIDAIVFAPIGMESTTTRFVAVEEGDHAMPHALAVDGSTRVMPLEIERGVEPIAPAGAVWSTVRDMMKYAQTEIGEGLAPNGNRVVSVENYRYRIKPRISMGENESYALGIDVETMGGQRVLQHSGGSMGFGTNFFVMPDAKVAIVILTNVRNGNAKEQLPFIAAVRRRILEELFASAKPRADKELAYYVKLRKREPYTPNKDRAWIAKLVGRYHEAVLGDAEIRETPNGVVFDAGEWQSAIDVVSAPDGTTRIVMLDPPFAGPGMLVVWSDPPTLVVPDQTTYTFARVK